MLWRKEQLKYALISAIIGILIWFLIDQIYTDLPAWDINMYNFSVSLGVFLGTFLVLSIIGKLKKPSFSLILPIFLIYYAIISSIEIPHMMLYYNTLDLHPSFTLSEILLQWLEYSAKYVVLFGLIGIASGIMMVRLTSKLEYSAFYFCVSSLIGVGAGLMLIQLRWIATTVPYLALFILIGTLTGITIIQIAWLRKRQTSNLHTSISVALWIIAFIIIVFLLVWLDHILFPPQIM